MERPSQAGSELGPLAAVCLSTPDHDQSMQTVPMPAVEPAVLSERHRGPLVILLALLTRTRFHFVRFFSRPGPASA